MQSLRAIVAIPTLNEAHHIGAVLKDLLQDPAALAIWVLDGGSSDDTRAIVTATDDPRVRLIDNPRRTQACAMNLAAGLAAREGAEVLIRADAHARYPKGFVSGLLHALQQTGADSVTVPLIASDHGANPWQQAGATLQRGWLGHGGAAHRRAGPSGHVSHGHHAAFRLPLFLALGGYDETFVANEDAEFDLRLTRAGGRIWQEASLPVAYVPRPGPFACFRQMWRNGRGRVRTAAKHRTPLALRQLLPVLACLALLIAVPARLSLADPLAQVLSMPGLAYLAILAAGALHLGRGRAGLTLRIAALALVSHMGFALGVLQQALILRPKVLRPLTPAPGQSR